MKILTHLGYCWRSSYWFVTMVVTFVIFVDSLVCTSLVPVSPFYLSHKGYYDVPALVGWLFTAYSLGLVSSTLPLAAFSARFAPQKWPLVAGLLLLVASQLMLWEAPSYVVMIIAQIIQGPSSALMWIFGLALICECSPPQVVGCQLGFAMGGIALGAILGPPFGSLLYDHLGIAGLLALATSLAGLGLIGRLLIIERPVDVPSVEEIPMKTHLQRGPSTGKVNGHSFFRIVKQMGESPRLLCAFCLELFTFGIVLSMAGTSLPLQLKDAYNRSTTQVGLFLLICGAPTFVAAPFAGYLTDKFGAEWVIPFGMALCIPWMPLLLLDMKLGWFTAIFAIDRFISMGVYAACSAEIAKASRKIEGVHYTHVYAMTMFAYGIGSVVGPLIAGQLYAHLHDLGWIIICVTAAGVRLLAIPFSVWWTGDVPLKKRFRKAVAKDGESKF